MKLLDDFLKVVGESGLPKGLDESLTDTWLAYEETKPEDPRFLSVLGFLHLLKLSGIRHTLPYKPESFYKEVRQEEFESKVKALAKRIQQLHIFDTLRIFKARFVLDTPIRGDTRNFRFDLCLVPRKAESLDSALARLRGLLYLDEVPRQLREEYKKTAINAKGPAKSALPPYTRMLSNPSSLGFLPLHVDKNASTSIHVCRAKDDMLVVRIMLSVGSLRPDWCAPRKHDDFLKSLLQKTLASIKR